MKEASVWLLCGAIVIGASLAISPREASAIPQFKKEWDAIYMDDDSTDAAVVELTTAAKKAKCNVCHAGKSKKKRNAYGAELSKLLKKTKDNKDVYKIKEAIEQVSEMHSVAGDDSSPTWGEVFASGTLPPDKEVDGE